MGPDTHIDFSGRGSRGKCYMRNAAKNSEIQVFYSSWLRYHQENNRQTGVKILTCPGYAAERKFI